MPTLLTDLYAVDGDNKIYYGVNTYRQILLKMRYLAPIGYLLGLSGISNGQNKNTAQLPIPASALFAMPNAGLIRHWQTTPYITKSLSNMPHKSLKHCPES